MRGCQLRELPEDGKQGLVQPGKAHPGFELDAASTQDSYPRLRSCARGRVKKQRLAGPSLAQHEQGISIRSGARQERVHQRQLFTAADRGIGNTAVRCLGADHGWLQASKVAQLNGNTLLPAQREPVS